MKKMSKLFTIIILMFMFIVNVNAVNNTFKVASKLKNGENVVSDWISGTKPTDFKLYGETTIYDFHVGRDFYVFQTADTYEGVFCLDPGKDVTAFNEYTKSGNPSLSCGLIAGIKGKDSDISYLGLLTETDFDNVATKGTTNISNLSSSAYVESYKKIQYYLWRYMDVELGRTGVCETDGGYVYQTIDSKKPYITISNKNAIMNIKDGYYVSDQIKLSSNLNYYVMNISGVSGAFLTTDINATTGLGTGENLLSGTNTYYVKVPVANITNPSNITITFKRGAVRYQPTVQRYISGTHQPLGVVALNKTTVQAENSLTLNIEGASINIVKTNSINNKALANVEFGLYKEDGKTVATTISGKAVESLKTDAKGKLTIAYIPEGIYVLKELNTLPGYKTQTEVAKFKVTVTNGNTTITDLTNYTDSKTKLVNIALDSKSKNTLNIKNEPIKQKFSKKDVTNEKEIEGAEIVISDEKGKQIVKFKSEKKPYEFYLEPGKYTMVETVAPKGYQKLETKFEFEVLENGTTKLISTTNKIKMDGTNITLYNYPMIVKVPDTNKSSIIYIIIGSIIVIAGGAIVVLKMKQNK